MKKNIIKSGIFIILTACALSGCVSRAGKTAMLTAKELVAAGSYSEAATQCAIAIGNGVTDKDFLHMYDVVNLYNAALAAYENGNTDEARSKISQIVDYSGLAMANDIERLKEKIKKADEVNEATNKALEKIDDLYDDEDYAKAQEELLTLNEYDMTDEQKEQYRRLQEKLEKKSKPEELAITDQNIAPQASVPAPAVDYSKYDNSLTAAYIMGAETGNVYFWYNASGNEHSTTLPNGTTLYATSQKSNGRTLVKWNGNYGWITSKYLNIGTMSTYTTHYHIEGASTGSVYVWKNAYDDEYYTTISNGTIVYPTGGFKCGRREIRWGDGYAWITAEYVR